MKGYVVLLGLLWVGGLLRGAGLALFGAHPELAALALAEAALFGLCLAAGVELAFGRRVVRLEGPRWGLAGRAALSLGGLGAFVVLLGPELGLPGGGPLDALLAFLPALLFAVPPILLAHERAKAR